MAYHAARTRSVKRYSEIRWSAAVSSYVRKEGAVIQEFEVNASTIILAIVVIVLFVLALRVAVATWSGKRGCHSDNDDDTKSSPEKEQ